MHEACLVGPADWLIRTQNRKKPHSLGVHQLLETFQRHMGVCQIVNNLVIMVVLGITGDETEFHEDV